VRGRPPSPRTETLANLMGFLGLTLAIVAVAALDVRRALPRPPPAPAPVGAARPNGGPPDAGVDAGTPAGQAVLDAGRPAVDAGGAVGAADGG
jgi:hypothetical protein